MSPNLRKERSSVPNLGDNVDVFGGKGRTDAAPNEIMIVCQYHPDGHRPQSYWQRGGSEIGNGAKWILLEIKALRVADQPSSCVDVELDHETLEIRLDRARL